MKRLTIKEVTPYLPFKLQWKFEGSDDIHEVMGIDITDFGIHLFSPYGDYGKCRIYEGKPLLRPLSQLTEEIEHNGERFVPIDRINNYGKTSGLQPVSYGICDRDINPNLTTYGGGSWEGGIEEDISTFQFYRLYEKLFEWHFDVFGLIDRNLALPIDGKEVEGE